MQPPTRARVRTILESAVAASQGDRAADELLAIYPDPADFLGSTAAARINGYLGGFGTKDQLEREIDRLGLSAAGKA